MTAASPAIAVVVYHSGPERAHRCVESLAEPGLDDHRGCLLALAHRREGFLTIQYSDIDRVVVLEVRDIQE